MTDETTLTLTLGETDDYKICVGLEEALKRLQLYETARVILTPEYAFGHTGLEFESFKIPPNAKIEYIIRLLAITKVSKNKNFCLLFV